MFEEYNGKEQLKIVKKSHECLWRFAAEKIFEKHLHIKRSTRILCFLSPSFAQHNILAIHTKFELGLTIHIFSKS